MYFHDKIIMGALYFFDIHVRFGWTGFSLKSCGHQLSLDIMLACYIMTLNCYNKSNIKSSETCKMAALAKFFFFFLQ